MASTTSSIQVHTRYARLLDSPSPRANCLHIIEPSPDEIRADRGNLYILVELLGDSLAGPTTHVDQVVREIQESIERTYYAAGGSVSDVLRQAINSAHGTLQQRNQRSPESDLQAGITCAAIVEHHLIIAAAGPSLALVATSQSLDQFPPDSDHYAGPIGGESPPTIHVYWHKLKTGDTLFLGESEWVLLSNIRTIGGAVANTSVGNLREVMDYLRRQSNEADILGLLLVYIEQPAQTPLAPAKLSNQAERAVHVADGAAAPRLPTAVGAPPPLRSIPRSGPTPLHEAGPGQAGKPSGSRQIYKGFFGFLQRTRWPRKLRAWLASLLLDLLPERRVRQPTSGPTQDPKAASTSDWVGSTPIPQPGPRPKRPAYQPPKRTQGNRARLVIFLAILIPLLTSAMVGATILREGAINQEDGLKLLQLAEGELIKIQQALSVNDKTTARAAMGEAQRYLDEATLLLGVTAEIRELSQIIAAEQQDLMQIRALYSLDVPLYEFSATAEPHRVVVFDQDIYMLDTGRQVIEHYRINPERTLLEENSGVILQQGDVVAGVTVGRLVDIAWQPRIPNFADQASLLVIDRNNNVFRYNRLNGATHLPLAMQNSLGSIGQVEMYNGRLYLTDERANQIYRYTPAGAGYDEPADHWFDDQVQSNLAGLVAMNIDSDIWLLSEDGTLLRYRQGQQLPFSLEKSPGLGGLMVDLAMDSNVNSSLLYLADATHDRILVFDKEGRYIEQYVDAENIALVGLRGLFLDRVTDTLYILTRSSLYVHPLPR